MSNLTRNRSTVLFKNEYTKYNSIKQRTNPSTLNIKSQKNYIARGILLCPEWRCSFENFIIDMGPCPKGYELDRIDNDKGYFKENCRWVPRQTNQHNRSKSKNNKNKYSKGVRFNKKINKFTAQICIDYIAYYLGCFKTEEEASGAYKKICIEWYGFYKGY